MHQKFVYLIVWGEYLRPDDIGTDIFIQFVFETEELAKKYVFKKLIDSKTYLFDLEASDIPNTYGEIMIGKEYKVLDSTLCYDYIKIKQYYLM